MWPKLLKEQIMLSHTFYPQDSYPFFQELEGWPFFYCDPIILIFPCRLGVTNSNLLHSYVSLDPRVSQLVFVVRAWAKAKGLTVGRQLGSYALTLMVLYFLQTRSPPVIPSLQRGFSSWIKEDDLHSTNDICDFDKLGSSQLEPELIDNWDCSFLRDTSKLAPSLNTESLSEYNIF